MTRDIPDRRDATDRARDALAEARAEVARLTALLAESESDLDSLRVTIEEHLPAYVLDDGTDEEATHAERVEYAGAEIARLTSALECAHETTLRWAARADAMELQIALAMAWGAAACEDAEWCASAADVGLAVLGHHAARAEAAEALVRDLRYQLDAAAPDRLLVPAWLEAARDEGAAAMREAAVVEVRRRVGGAAAAAPLEMTWAADAIEALPLRGPT